MAINSAKILTDTLIYSVKTKEERIRNDIIEDIIIQIVDELLIKAIVANASDIHLQPTSNEMRIRFRIDGVLYDQASINTYQQLLVLSRIKVLSSLDISQKRIPQDGKLRIKVSNDTVNLRIATFPTTHGEKMVIRILDKANSKIDLENLGFSEEVLDWVRKLIIKPQGFFLVTGPTGSGKTTTLYAILSQLNTKKYNIVTMEDPVESDLNGITQSQVNPKAGFSFQNGLRSLLRQDPDVIMLGEIRDKETAQIAIEAALTGHLVFSTLHTEDSVGAIIRLIDMGIEPFLISAALTGVLAQRLVRKLCICKKGIEPIGCRLCMYIGYRGRTAVCDLLIIDQKIKELILEKNSMAIKDHRKAKPCDDSFNGHLKYKLDNELISQEEYLQAFRSF